MAILTTSENFVGAESVSWQAEMKRAIRSVDQLIKHLNLPDGETRDQAKNVAAVGEFPVFVPFPYLDRIRREDWNDPLLRQVIPDPHEDRNTAGYQLDPLEESAAMQSPGILKKYNGRALLITAGACAIHCRYCFRRHFPYESTPKAIRQWELMLDPLKKDASINELILSGGDPLTLVDSSLKILIDKLESIEHLTRLRIHTRLPVVIPQRVTDSLLRILTNRKLKIVVVVHCNHAREIDDFVEMAFGRLKQTGAILLNQSVLLRNVNDDVETLIDLSNRLIECAVLPYYLHKNDPVEGTSHFEVNASTGIEFIKQMRNRLPGYAVPRFVQEVAGELSKTILA